MGQHGRERLEPIGFGSSLLAAVGVVAPALSCAGLYALIAFGVGARTREVVATWMPARQAAHVDPAVALRGE